MAQKRAPDQTRRVAAAALSLAGKEGWAGLSPDRIARKAKTRGIAPFADAWGVLRHLLDTLDAAALKETGAGNGPWRDTLFELLMTRFDLMQPHRAAYAAILPDLLKAPHAALALAERHLRWAKKMLEAANAPASPLHAAALGAAYLPLARTWARDDSADLSATMAATDKMLAGLEKLFSAVRTGS